MLTVAIPKRNKLQNIIVLTPKDGRENGQGNLRRKGELCGRMLQTLGRAGGSLSGTLETALTFHIFHNTCLSELS